MKESESFENRGTQGFKAIRRSRALASFFGLTALIASLTLTLVPTSALAKLVVGTTTQDLEAIVRAVGGEKVDTFSIAKGTQDPHQIEAKPSFMVKVRSADLMIAQGLDLESAWLVPLIQGARNPKVAIGSNGYLELGDKLEPIEVAKASVSRGEGDVHPNGNPHFQLDPVRLGKAALLIADRMAELDSADPSNGKLYRDNALALQKRLDEQMKTWSSRIAKSGVKEFVSYHKTFSYFANRFGLKNTLHLEPKPGIPPTASHILEVIHQMQDRKVRLVLIENFFDDTVRGKIEHEIPGVKVLKVPAYVGGTEAVQTNIELIESLVKSIEVATVK